MPAWSPLALLALVALMLFVRMRRRQTRRTSGGSPPDRALAAAVMQAHPPSPAAEAEAARPTPLDVQKRQARETDGRRVRLAGAVVDGALNRDALQTILIERQNIGEQAKAVRLLLQYFPLPEAVPVLSRALHANGESFLHLARFAFGQCGMDREIGAALAEVNPADEDWLLGALLFADPFCQRPVSAALARVGTRRSLDALRAMAEEARPAPWIRDATEALHDRLRTDQAGGLAMAPGSAAEGGLSSVDAAESGSSSWSDR